MPDYSGSCAAGDPYLPYRRIVSPHRIRELSTLKPWRAVTDIIMNWTLILVAFGFVAIHPVWWAVLVAIPVIGNRYYALFIIGHDAMHRRLFPNIKRNDFWADLLIFAPSEQSRASTIEIIWCIICTWQHYKTPTAS